MGIDPMLPLDNAGTGALGPARPSASMSFSWLILGRLLSGTTSSGQLKIAGSEDVRQRGNDVPRRNRCSLWFHLHGHLHKGTHFDCTVTLKNGTSLRKLHGLIEIAGLYQSVTADDVLGFRKRTVGYGLLFTFHQLTGAIQRLALIFDVTPSLRAPLANSSTSA